MDAPDHSPSPSPDLTVSLTDVTVRAGSTTVLRNADLSVNAGEAIGLFGPNGSGKTTLLRLLATLDQPDYGSAIVLGADLSTPQRFNVRGRIAMIGHIPALYPELTLRENTTFAAKILGAPRARVDEVLTAVGLAGAADRRVIDCSHGMQRRTEFGRLLLSDPDLVLLDEPHSALDEDATELVSTVVADTIERGGSVIVSSHDRERVIPMVHRTVELKSGRLVA